MYNNKFNSNAESAFNKTIHDKLRCSIIIHIDGDPILSTKDIQKNLKVLYKEYLKQQIESEGVGENKFSFTIIFALEKKFLKTKLKKTIDEFYGYASGRTKAIKSNTETLPYRMDVYDGSIRFPY